MDGRGDDTFDLSRQRRGDRMFDVEISGTSTGGRNFAGLDLAGVDRAAIHDHRRGRGAGFFPSGQ